MTRCRPRCRRIGCRAGCAGGCCKRRAPSVSTRRHRRAPVGQAELRAAGSRGELIVDHLPLLPPNRTYELWIVKGKHPRLSTLLSVASDGTADLGVPGDVIASRSLLVTVEPRGGSLVPTSRAVIQLPLDYVPRSSPT